MSAVKVIVQRQDMKLDQENRTTAEEAYKASEGGFRSGCWGARYGKVDLDYNKDEFCYLLEGEVIVTDSDGQSHNFKAGDAFVLPRGFKGTWETVTPTRKLYVIRDYAAA